MRPMGKASDSKSRKVTPPSPSYMTNDQFASYLSELRSKRIARPSGARPLPSGARPAPSRTSASRYSLDAPSSPAESQTPATGAPSRSRAPSRAPSVAGGSLSSRYSVSSARGRDYYPAQPTQQPLKPSEVVPTATYMERGQRWMEKEEACSLRDAMDEMSLREGPKEIAADEEESRIHNAALDEAAELVWQHQNPGKVPQPDGPYRYRPHLRKNSYAHARTASAGRYGEDIVPSGLARDAGSRSVSGSSTDSDGYSRRSRPSMDSVRSRPKAYGSLGSRSGVHAEPRQRSSMKRNISGEVERPFSGDQIWEEPESASPHGSVRAGRASPDKLASKPQNPLIRVRFDSPREEAAAARKSLDRVEIQRNPPSKSRDAQYTTNADLPPALRDDSVERKNGMEVRGKDIREATSMRLKDRSSKLPEPTAVSDSPGRPIVSFDANWRAPDESTDVNPEKQQQQPQEKEAASPSPHRGRFQPHFQPQPQPQPVVVPTISVEEDPASRPRAPDAGVPSISVDGPGDASPRPLPTINVPTIAVDEPSSGNNNNGNSNDIPTIVAPDNVPAAGSDGTSGSGGRSLPRPQRSPRPQSHWSRAPGALGRDRTICHECGFPIEGRFVALAGSSERFHPQCLSCFACGTRLEAMEISPEPDQVRHERLDRIRRRAAGEILDETPGATMAEDGDDRLRFYCHLDWHERFAPRCKHCKTPILGEHIVALGQHWHFGHFFCAECGDPFEHGMTHIEKDGYAWCIKCQTKRTERRAPKCRKCRAAVIGEYIQALGGEWHEHCFRCAECQGSFDDGQIFPKEIPGGMMVVLCTPCRAKELKR
ncbi:LIM domain-containing protein-like protein [Hapsidospora chrysogenum ATCC 11550]|uniref:LIM domain-containing protein-like protein n=1 Tax=Hapsidospora chrysogenum (strain ATCC 11550 / CBS 779.69 / DSM 880 / IAM 14645 / JCM 23072 / IMI 49137) TaxID=857340 RepID=A0A086SZX2_HAPC1|nr:LIM domain-containing protein-like protein [Hapsidospora chrysogenum ATCC 11550]